MGEMLASRMLVGLRSGLKDGAGVPVLAYCKT